MLEEVKIAFIGSGAMGEAMIKGMLAKTIVVPAQIIASDPVESRRNAMRSQYGIETTDDNSHAVSDADVAILSVKPQVFSRVADNLSNRIGAKTLVLSIIAGVPIHTLRAGLGHGRIVRSMPNTPAQVGKGVTVWAATADVSEVQREQTATILGALGEQIAVSEERYLDMATGLSGSGPGFVFLLIEAMIDGGVQIGFSRDDAQKMVLQTIDGCVELVRATEMHPADLRNRVTSPAGTTAAGLYELEAGNVRATMVRAIDAAYRRSQELGALYDERNEMSIIGLLMIVLQLYSYVLLARALVSWIPNLDPHHPAVQFLYRVTEPVLEPIRKLVPPLGGTMDISIIIAFFALILLQQVLGSLA